MQTAITSPGMISPTLPSIYRWLEEFAESVRQVNFSRAADMFADEVVSFGTFARMVVGVENLVDEQWKQVWGSTRGFHFLTDEAHVTVNGDIAWIAVTWTSQGRDESGNWYDRPGRATIILQRDGQRWLCVHSHLSRQPAAEKIGDATPT